METKVPIKKRNKEFGIFTWPKELDTVVKEILANRDQFVVSINNKEVKRKVSYKYRKFSVSKKLLQSKNYFVLSKENGRIRLFFE